MKTRFKLHGKTIGLTLFAALLWSVAALWAWNTLIVDLLGLPEMAFRHAFALYVLILSTAAAIALPLRMASRGQL